MIHGFGVGALLAALLGAGLGAGPASAAERDLVLEVVINGRATGRVGEFLDRDGSLYAKPSELVELGFVLPRGIAADADPIALSSLPHVRARVDEARQTLLVETSDAALRPTELGNGTAVALGALSPSGFGALFNYDAVATFTGRQATGGALTDLRVFSHYGVLQSSALVNITPFAGQSRFVRLDTTFTGTQFAKLRRWRLGDVVTGALPWSRAVRLGGVQVASDFGLRPDLVTFPLPVIGSSTAVPSTVNVVVNGVQQLSQPVQPGPFIIRTLPVVTGAGEVAVTVLDALGRQTRITLPFYASAALLKPGLGSYSLEIGAVRQDYGLSTDRYSGWAVNQSSRYGVTEWLTLESHAEATDRLGLLGGGATMLVGTLGVFNVAVAGSIGRGRISAPSGGSMIAAGFERATDTLSFGVSGTYSTSGYHDIAAEYGSPMPRYTLNANLGYQLGALGNIGLAYSGRSSTKQPLGVTQGPPDETNISEPQVHLITGSYNIPVAGRAAFFATGFKDLRKGGVYGIGVGLSFSLGRSTSASVEASLDNGRSTASVNIARSAQRQNDYGYRVQVSEGAVSRRSLEGEYLSRWSRLSAGVDQSSGQVAGRVGARGALVLVGGNLFASDQISDSFAVVSSGDVAGVPVLYENRPMGKTDSRGKLLIPSMLSYRNNLLAIDATKLPPDVEVGQTSFQVRPPDRSGVIVDFQIRHVAAALLTLHDRNNRPLPLGSVVKMDNGADQPVGYDGEAYVTGLTPANRLEVVLPSGTHCVVQFAYKPMKGDIPLIGPLRCQ